MLFRVQKDTKNPYVVLNKSFFLDEELSAKAKGILGYIFTLPDDWKIYLKELQTHFKDGVKSISSGVRELIDKGYIVRVTLRDEKGKFKGYMYDVYEVSSETPKTENRKTENRKTENRKGHTTIYINKLNNNRLSNDHTHLKNLCDKTFGEKIKESLIKELVNTCGADVVEQYLEGWELYRPHAKQGQLAYFIYCVKNQVPPPSLAKKNGKTPKYADFKQREYDEAFYDRFYHNLDD